MSNPVALGLGALILICLLLDGFANDWGAVLFMGAKIVDLIHFVAFWR
ncbi:hypothetical protein [Pseudothioclava nitratireducens]|jgi:hypothetical protein|nr:hypothetical protein [Defluviimonas nitratireducens]MDF1620022.1 hypothetical protein [Defluviimonas nitratireducens]